MLAATQLCTPCRAPRAAVQSKRCRSVLGRTSAAVAEGKFLHSHEVRYASLCVLRAARVRARARSALSEADFPVLVSSKAADGSMTFSFDIGDGKPPAKREGGAPARSAAASSGETLEAQMKNAWAAAAAAVRGGAK